MRHKPRIFVDCTDLKSMQQLHITDPGDLHHLTHVVRCKVADPVECVTINGDVWKCTVHKQQRHALVLIAISCTLKGIIRTTLSLGFGLIRPHRIAMLVEKCTEVGTTDFYPLITKHTQLSPQHLDLNRLRTIAKSAAQQSRQTQIPKIHPPRSLLEFGVSSTCIICHASAQRIKRGTTLDNATTVLVGPEGGFSAEEEGYCIENGAVPLSLGSQILRTETAAIIATHLLATKTN